MLLGFSLSIAVNFIKHLYVSLSTVVESICSLGKKKTLILRRHRVYNSSDHELRKTLDRVLVLPSTSFETVTLDEESIADDPCPT